MTTLTLGMKELTSTELDLVAGGIDWDIIAVAALGGPTGAAALVGLRRMLPVGVLPIGP